MTALDWIQVIGGALLALLGIYMAFRVASAAWYKSKREFDQVRHQPKG